MIFGIFPKIPPTKEFEITSVILFTWHVGSIYPKHKSVVFNLSVFCLPEMRAWPLVFWYQQYINRLAAVFMVEECLVL